MSQTPTVEALIHGHTVRAWERVDHIDVHVYDDAAALGDPIGRYTYSKAVHEVGTAMIVAEQESFQKGQ